MAVAGFEWRLLVARLLFGGIIIVTGTNHFLRTEQLTGYAAQKGLSAPELSVFGSGGVLVLGGLAIVTGILPVLGAIAVALFLVIAAVTVHNSWAVPEDQQQTQMTQFLKNIGLAGGALTIAVLGLSSWAFGAGIRLF